VIIFLLGGTRSDIIAVLVPRSERAANEINIAVVEHKDMAKTGLSSQASEREMSVMTHNACPSPSLEDLYFEKFRWSKK